MAGRSGNAQVTVEGLQVVAINGDLVWVKGMVPGAMNGIVTITKMGPGKFAGLIETEKKEVELPVEAPATEVEAETPVVEVAETKNQE
jgi:hypothetical protein